MASPIRWLHLSDFHVGKDDYAGQKMFDHIIAHVKKRKEEGFEPDLLFITGDLANKGLKAEYDEFWLEFVMPLQDVIGNGISDKTFVVPGNHDVDRDIHRSFDRDEMLAPSAQHFDPTEKGLKERQIILPRFQAFVESDLTLTKGAFLSEAGAFAITVNVRGISVGIAGINTAWLSKDEHDEKKLTPGKGIVEQALTGIKEAKIRIVLGHHPVGWLQPALHRPINNLFGQASVVYLHGHLHDEWIETAYVGGRNYLAVQAGAAFQAREGEVWKNGFVWAEADAETGEVKFQARRWTPGQTWVPATEAFHENFRQGDWWHYPLPGSLSAKSLTKAATSAAPPTPKGWAVSKTTELALHLKPLAEDAAVRFFNGAAPSWSTALSTSIPRRKIVAALASRFQDAEAAGRPLVTVLLAAGCEGKTTAMLQAAYQVVQDKANWRILRRVDDSEPFQAEGIIPQLAKEYYWLVVIDEADRAAKPITEFLPRLPRELHGRVHFLLACRDSDWLGSRLDDLRWNEISTFHKERFSGLNNEDAKAIVSAWGDFGNAGLGDMSDVEENKRAELLIHQAHEEAKIGQGALFGALLTVRYGSDLPNHARLMLDRLDQRFIPGGATLRHALAYVAAMHAEGLEFLSRPVLAQVLACPLQKLHRDVLVPLGQEAAATSTSSFVFTRHKRIAQAIIEVLENEFGVDLGEVFVSLGRAALELIKQKQYLPENPSAWRFEIAKHFFNTHKTDLALRVASAVLKCEQDNPKTIANVSNLYREAGANEQALYLFHNVPKLTTMDRGFYLEWGIVEGLNGNAVGNAILVAFSLSDDCDSSRVENDRSKMGLAGLGRAFSQLFDNYREMAFRNARIAVAILGQKLVLDSTTAGHLKRHVEECTRAGATVPTIAEAFDWLRKGIKAAEAIGVSQLVESVVPDATHLDYDGLQRLIYASVDSA
ncbi:MAG TPA: hypothetical protein DCP71_07865 [Verrucomicrobiales bacterium]|nr:hypothetical protein [Verrucomicrobiales bacterium]